MSVAVSVLKEYITQYAIIASVLFRRVEPHPDSSPRRLGALGPETEQAAVASPELDVAPPLSQGKIGVGLVFSHHYFMQTVGLSPVLNLYELRYIYIILYCIILYYIIYNPGTGVV